MSTEPAARTFPTSASKSTLAWSTSGACFSSRAIISSSVRCFVRFAIDPQYNPSNGSLARFFGYLFRLASNAGSNRLDDPDPCRR